MKSKMKTRIISFRFLLLDSPSPVLPYQKIFTLSLSPSSVQGKKEILGYGNTGDGESRGRKRKTYNSFKKSL
jgi:hypothetical protein